MTAKLPPEPKVQGQKPITVQAGDVLHPGPPGTGSQARLRREAARRRAALGEAERMRAAERLAHRLATFLSTHPVPTLASCFPVRNEIDPNGFRLLMGRHAPALYLPRLAGEALEFVRWDTTTPMGPNAFGIPEPLEGPVLPASACSCILLPLTAFDPCGRRLGSGGGYYDRTLAFRLNPAALRRACPLLIGVAHECQRTDRISPNPWDVPLDAIATDTCWYHGGKTYPELTWHECQAP